MDVPSYTYNDYKNWKEDWELIYGYPYFISPPVWRHNHVQLNMVKDAHTQLAPLQHYMVFSALDWKINAETVVRPDMMIVCGEIKSDYLEFPPVLVAEVLSPSTLLKDRNIKFELYKENGVRYYLMVDYTKQTVEVFELIDNMYKSVERSNFILNENCEVTFDFKAIF